ncbi:MAG: hypothetical protein WBZ42_02660 [Halobacteriota archaeon]
MATNKNLCYYGLHIGCLNANNPNCRTCAEHLTHAVNYIAHEATTCSVGAHNDGANDGARYQLRLRRAVVT